MNSTPLISVMIPAFNHGNFVEKCLDSVLEDDYPNKEVVIINDGSTDNTHDVISCWVNKYKQQLPIHYKNRIMNHGLTRTLNELINLCNGEYVVLLASDDYLLPGGISKRLDYLLNNEDKFGVFGDCNVVDEAGNIFCSSGLRDLHVADTTRYFSDETLKREIIYNWSVPGPVLMVRKSIYELIGSYDEDLYIEDWDFYLRMVADNLLGYIDCKVSAYRLHQNSLYFASKEDKRRGWAQLRKTAYKNLCRFKGRDRQLLIKKVILSYYNALLEKNGN